MKCEICNTEVKAIKSLSIHLARVHKDVALKDYYDKFMRKDGEGVCKVCGGDSKFVSLTEGYRTYCSPKCSAIDNLGKEYWANLAEETFKRTGYRYCTQNPEIKEKIKRSNLAKYGVEFHTQAKAVRAKIEATTLKHYGVASVLADKARRKEWNDAREAKTGHRTVISSPEVQAKLKATKSNPEYTKARREKFRPSFEAKLANVNCQLLEIVDADKLKFKCLECGLEQTGTRVFVCTDRADLGVTPCTQCRHKHPAVSKPESSLVEYIQSIYAGTLCLNDRTVLNGLELDVCIPDLKLAIEFDGLYFHRADKVGVSYHADKSSACEAQGIQLIHIFEDEWELHRDIVKSRLNSKLGNSSRIFARRCEGRRITDAAVVKSFLTANHIQGFCVSSIAYGLYFNSELVAMMTFGKSRFKGSEFELLRYCGSLGCTIVGGASKLLSMFHRDHPEISSIVSYADRRWSTGNLYRQLGFTLESISRPSYYYVKNGVRLNRIGFQKHKLIKKYGYPESMTETEMAADLGVYRIYDCGQYRFVKTF